ncbi:MAG: hypothetical protein IJC85_05120 [Oscillospiraceae bacterium]|nr:hypothetical protein [Oscillospiraceae bacterium]
MSSEKTEDGSEIVSEPSSSPEVSSEPKSEPKSEVKSEPKSEVKSEPKSEVKSEIKSQVAEKEPTSQHVHNYITTVVQPGCSNAGYTNHVCSCGDSYTDQIVEASHTLINWTCTVCGEPDRKVAFDHLVGFVKEYGDYENGAEGNAAYYVYNRPEKRELSARYDEWVAICGLFRIYYFPDTEVVWFASSGTMNRNLPGNYMWFDNMTYIELRRGATAFVYGLIEEGREKGSQYTMSYHDTFSMAAYGEKTVLPRDYCRIESEKPINTIAHGKIDVFLDFYVYNTLYEMEMMLTESELQMELHDLGFELFYL